VIENLSNKQCGCSLVVKPQPRALTSSKLRRVAPKH